jgi:hypothetical protein
LPAGRHQLPYWKSRYGGAEGVAVVTVKDLESENAKLRHIYAQLALDNATTKSLIAKSVGSAWKYEAARTRASGTLQSHLGRRGSRPTLVARLEDVRGAARGTTTTHSEA